MAVRSIQAKDTVYYSIKGTLHFHSSVSNSYCSYTGEHIARYKIDNSLCSEGLPIGAVASSSFELEVWRFCWSGTNTRVASEDYIGARVEMFISETNNSDSLDYRPFGVWYVESAEASEDSGFIVLRGCDILGWKGGTAWTDFKTSSGALDVGAMTYVKAPNSRYSRYSTDASTSGQIIKNKIRNKYGVTIRNVKCFSDDIGGMSCPVSVDEFYPNSYIQFNGAKDVFKADKSREIQEGATLLNLLKDYATANMGFARVNWSGEIEIRTIGWTEAVNEQTWTTLDNVRDRNGDLLRVYSPPTTSSYSTLWVVPQGYYAEFSDAGGAKLIADSVTIPTYLSAYDHRTYKNYVVCRTRYSSNTNNSLTNYTSYKHISMPKSTFLQSRVIDCRYSYDLTNRYIYSDELASVIAWFWLAHGSSFLNKSTVMSWDSGSLKWFGHPDFQCGDEIEVTCKDGNKKRLISNRTSIVFDNGGLTVESECIMPSIGSGKAEDYDIAQAYGDTFNNPPADATPPPPSAPEREDVPDDEIPLVQEPDEIPLVDREIIDRNDWVFENDWDLNFDRQEAEYIPPNIETDTDDPSIDDNTDGKPNE